MDRDIENLVQTCYECQQHRDDPPKAPLHPWPWPSQPWSRLHIDYAGPTRNTCFLSSLMHTPNG